MFHFQAQDSPYSLNGAHQNPHQPPREVWVQNPWLHFSTCTILKTAFIASYKIIGRSHHNIDDTFLTQERREKCTTKIFHINVQ